MATHHHVPVPMPPHTPIFRCSAVEPAIDVTNEDDGSEDDTYSGEEVDWKSADSRKRKEAGPEKECTQPKNAKKAKTAPSTPTPNAMPPRPQEKGKVIKLRPQPHNKNPGAIRAQGA